MTDDHLKNLNYLIEDRAGSIVERLTEKLKTLILTGELPEGYVFPNELELCDYLRVGRSTLRETYKALASCGLISRSKRGTVVNPGDVVAANMPYHMLIQAADVRDLLEFRTLIEKDTARIAAERATAQNKKKLSEYLEKMKQSVGDAAVLTMYDTMFHLEIARAAGNVLISRMLGSMIDAFAQTISYNFTHDTAVRERAIRFHGEILDAIAVGDAEKAHSVMQQHLQDVVHVASTLKGE